MSKIESRTGKIEHNEERVFGFLSDFNNFEQLIPKDKVSDWSSDGESCSFKVAGIGQVGMRMIEKQPNNLIKITSEGKTPVNFQLWIQLKKVEDWDTRIKITVEPKVNALMMGMVKKPLKSFVDSLIDQAEKYPF
jgi:carbon monoxide dehydrogenase subunit G